MNACSPISKIVDDRGAVAKATLMHSFQYLSSSTHKRQVPYFINRVTNSRKR